MKHFANTFDSAHWPRSQRRDAFVQFCDSTANPVLSGHDLMSIGADNPELHSVTRHIGDEIYAASTRSTGYGMTFQRRRSGSTPGMPVSVGLISEGNCEFRTERGTHHLKTGDLYISTLTATKFAVNESLVTRILIPDQRASPTGRQNGDLIVLGGSTPMGQLLASTVTSIEQTFALNGRLSARDSLSQIAQKIVLRVLDAETPHLNSSPKNQLREKARGYILENLADENLSPDAVAAYLGMSRAAAFRLFSGDGGVMSFVNQIRLNVGQSMLASASPGQRRVSEIASLCGFKSPSHFSETFKKAFGYPPSKTGQC